MTLAPLLNASPVIQAHACFAFAAIGLGAKQMALPKGAPPHRRAGWMWAILMSAVAATSLFIHAIGLLRAMERHPSPVAAGPRHRQGNRVKEARDNGVKC